MYGIAIAKNIGDYLKGIPFLHGDDNAHTLVEPVCIFILYTQTTVMV